MRQRTQSAAVLAGGRVYAARFVAFGRRLLQAGGPTPAAQAAADERAGAGAIAAGIRQRAAARTAQVWAARVRVYAQAYQRRAAALCASERAAVYAAGGTLADVQLIDAALARVHAARAGIQAAQAAAQAAQAAALIRSRAHLQAGVDAAALAAGVDAAALAAAADAAENERAAFGRISERAALHAAARVCQCDNCAVCGGIRTICGVCRQCVRCHDHRQNCKGCKGIPPPVSADELDAAAEIVDARHRQAAGGPVLSVRRTILSNAFGHFSDEVHAAGERAAAVLAAQAATTAGRQRLRTMYDESRAASYPSERAGRLSGYRVDQSDGHGHDL